MRPFLLDFLSMLRIRLQRVGRKHESSFRVVLTEGTNSTKTGRVQEILGSYNPRTNQPVMKEERVKYWISVGAKPTDTVHNLLISQKIIEGKKINVLSRKSPIKKEAPEGKKQEDEKIAATAVVAEEPFEDEPIEAPAEGEITETTPKEAVTESEIVKAE